MTVKKWVALLIAMLCLAQTALASEIVVPVVGGEAPDFEIQTIDGETFTLSKQRGRVVLINIWATWCGPCVSEMPDLNRLAQDYEDQLVVIGINCGETEQEVIDICLRPILNSGSADCSIPRIRFRTPSSWIPTASSPCCTTAAA